MCSDLIKVIENLPEYTRILLILLILVISFEMSKPTVPIVPIARSQGVTGRRPGQLRREASRS